MPSKENALLEEPIEGLWATPPSPLPFLADVEVRAFLLRRKQGNVIVYNAPGITSAASAIRDLGGATRLLINHGHEEIYGAPSMGTAVFVSERDRAEAARSLPIAGTFAERQMIDDDLEVIPIPGHTSGSTAYLWDSGSHRFLFTGDQVSIEHGEWLAVVLGSSDRDRYLDSLALMGELDFDVLVPWAATKGQPYVDVVSRLQAQERIDAIITRLEAGEDR